MTTMQEANVTALTKPNVFAWDEANISTTEMMWLWGYSATEIANIIGAPSRSAVMGKINRMGLTGKGGSYVGANLSGAELNVKEIRKSVESLTGSPFTWSDKTDRAAMIQMAAILVGQDSDKLAKALGKGKADIDEVIRMMDQTGIWKANGRPPSGWWKNGEGNIEILLDSMVLSGHCSIKFNGNEKLYHTAEIKEACCNQQ